MSTYGSNAYGQNVYGGPAVWDVSVSEAGSLADDPSGQLTANVAVAEAGAFADHPAATANFVGSIHEAGVAIDTILISRYVQAPLPTHPPAMRRAMRIR